MSNQATAHHSHYLPWMFFFTIFYLKNHGKDWALASALHLSPFLMQAKPRLQHLTVVKSYFLLCLYTVSLFWPLLLKTPAVLGRQNCLAKMLLPLRSQVSACGRPKQDFCTIAPRNRSQAHGERPTAGPCSRPGLLEPEGFWMPPWACSYSCPELHCSYCRSWILLTGSRVTSEWLAEAALKSGLCSW